MGTASALNSARRLARGNRASATCLQVVAGGGLERVEAGPGEPADETLVDVGEPGMGEVVAQVVEVGPGVVGADGLADGLGEG